MQLSECTQSPTSLDNGGITVYEVNRASNLIRQIGAFIR